MYHESPDSFKLPIIINATHFQDSQQQNRLQNSIESEIRNIYRIEEIHTYRWAGGLSYWGFKGFSSTSLQHVHPPKNLKKKNHLHE